MDKRQLLIDTILNEFDVPKLYLHKFHEPVKRGAKSYDYAIIDGKQRLETMWSFVDGKMALAEDFEFFKGSKVKAGNMTYAELGKAYPDLKVQFDSFQLTTVCIETDELEMIEEMFSRLNESAPLTAPRKGTPMVDHCQARSGNWLASLSSQGTYPFRTSVIDTSILPRSSCTRKTTAKSSIQKSLLGQVC